VSQYGCANIPIVDREELSNASAELLSEIWIGPGRVDDERRGEWLGQVVKLLEDVLAHTDRWCVLPTAISDRMPPDAELLHVALAFLDSAALYRVVPAICKGQLLLRTERIPFDSFRHVLVSDSRYHGAAPERHWQFRTERDAFNQTASEGEARSTEFLHELARRLGWPPPGS
jgi:hypothetical protein